MPHPNPRPRPFRKPPLTPACHRPRSLSCPHPRARPPGPRVRCQPPPPASSVAPTPLAAGEAHNCCDIVPPPLSEIGAPSSRPPSSPPDHRRRFPSHEELSDPRPLLHRRIVGALPLLPPSIRDARRPTSASTMLIASPARSSAILAAPTPPCHAPRARHPPPPQVLHPHPPESRDHSFRCPSIPDRLSVLPSAVKGGISLCWRWHCRI
jgi:hypothetical protein